ncbi:MAG: hypothetical protein LBU87_02025 [Lactobacillales bacterium]|jgi:hypothetical protein|nr:hypothetical protein [Lactobacillales bacterium]
MSPKEVIEVAEESKAAAFLSGRKGLIFAILFSLLWFVLCGDYIWSTGWWQNRVNLSLIEFVGSICGFLLPVILVGLFGSYIDRFVYLKKEAMQLQSYFYDLVYPTPGGPKYTQQLTQELRTQAQEFKDVFKDVSEKTAIVRQDLKQWLMELNTVVTHVDTKTIGAIKSIAEHIHNVTQVTEQANEQASQVSSMFSEQAVILQRVTNQTAGVMTDLNATLIEGIAGAEKVSQNVLDTNKQTGVLIGQMTSAQEILSRQADEIKALIDTYEESAKVQNARLFGNLEKILSVFRAQGDLMQEEVEGSLARLRDVEEGLSHKSAAVLGQVSAGISKMSEAGAAFETGSEKMMETIKSAHAGMAAVTEEIQQNTKLIDQKIAKVFKKTSPGEVLKDVSGVLKKLQKVSIDLSQIFTPKAQESLWEKYYAGDKSAFMRHVTEKISAKKSKQIRDMYAKDGEFKKAVVLYMSEFERMTKMAEQGDENSMLISVLIGSDVGRLYMVLADILKKEG